MGASKQAMTEKDEDFDFEADEADSSDTPDDSERVTKVVVNLDARRRLEDYRERREMEKLLKDDFDDFDD